VLCGGVCFTSVVNFMLLTLCTRQENIMSAKVAIEDLKAGQFIAYPPNQVSEVTGVYTYGDEVAITVLAADYSQTTHYYRFKTPFTLAERPENWAEVRKNSWPNLLRSTTYKSNNGADPEMFVVDKNNQLIPAWEFLPKKPQELNSYVPYWDGFQAEFRVQPSSCLNAQNDGAARGMEQVLGYARRKFPDARLTAQSVFEIPRKMMESAKDEHVALGCAPSMNAYGLMGEEVPDPRLLRWRFAGGHIHKSWPSLTPAVARRAVKAYDAILAIPTVVMFQQLDQPVRRKFYGLPGEYRMPKHGLEYRVLSSAWLCHPAVAQFVRELHRLVTGLVMAQTEEVFEFEEERVIHTLLNNDVDEALKMVRKNLKQYEALFGLAFNSYTNSVKAVKKGLELLQQPVGNIVNPASVEQNWRFSEWIGDAGLPQARWRTFANTL